MRCCLLLLYATTMNYFLIGLCHAMKSGFSTTTRDNQLSGWTKRKLQRTSQSQTCTKKGHSHCLVVCCHCDPLQLSEPWWNHWSEKYAKQIDEMHWKLQCLQPSLVNRKGPNLLHDNAWPHVAQPMLQKLNKSGYKILPHSPYSPDLSPTDYFFEHLNNFLQGKWFHKPAWGRKCFLRVKSWRTDFFFF